MIHKQWRDTNELIEDVLMCINERLNWKSCDRERNDVCDTEKLGEIKNFLIEIYLCRFQLVLIARTHWKNQ